MVMKLIITESQYKELNKIDDIYDGLDPYYRRRIDYIDIKDDIDMRIGFRQVFPSQREALHGRMNVLKKSPRGIDGHINDIIHNVVWSTIPDEWGGSEDDKLVGYVYEMMDRIKKKYRGYIMGKLLKMLEDEDNN
jgi:hypothetical protein